MKSIIAPGLRDHPVLACLWLAFWAISITLVAALVVQSVADHSESGTRNPVRVGAITHEDVVSGFADASPTSAAAGQTSWWTVVVRSDSFDRESLDLTLRATPVGDGIENAVDAWNHPDRDILIMAALAQFLNPPDDGVSNEYSATIPASGTRQPPLLLGVRPTSGFGPAASNSAFSYPFDSYGYSVRIAIGNRPSTTEDVAFSPQPALPCFAAGGLDMDFRVCRYTMTVEIDGFTLRMQPDSFWDTTDGATDPLDGFVERLVQSGARGQIGIHVVAARSAPERIYVVLVLFTLLGTMVAVWRVLHAVRILARPPTGEIMVWVAALTFAILAVRASLPVQLGVGLDYIFVPLLMFVVLATIEIGAYWTTRSDFDGGAAR